MLLFDPPLVLLFAAVDVVELPLFAALLRAPLLFEPPELVRDDEELVRLLVE